MLTSSSPSSPSSPSPPPAASAPLTLGRWDPATYINPQPVSKRSIIRYNPRIDDPYRGKRAADPTFEAIAAKVGGTALGTIYQLPSKTPTKPPKRYLGKVGTGRRVFINDTSTYRTLTKKEMNYEVILEKIAYDLYHEFGRGIYHVPKNYLSRQPILDDYTRGHPVAISMAATRYECIEQGVDHTIAPPTEMRLSNESLRIMSHYIEEYQDLTHATTQDPTTGTPIPFITYLTQYHRPPETLLTPTGTPVPIKGLIGLLAVARILADTDSIGGTGANAGILWIKAPTGQIIAAQAVKIDPGEAFHFDHPANWAYNTYHRRRGRTLDHIKDLQIAQNDERITIHWEALTPPQKTEYLQVLYNTSRYLHAPEILNYLFFRDGHFNRSPTEQNPHEIATRFKDQLISWLTLQQEIYHEELTQFKQNYQTQIICTEHIDQWGEYLLDQQEKKLQTITERTQRELQAVREGLTQELEAERVARQEALEEKERALAAMRTELRESAEASQVLSREQAQATREELTQERSQREALGTELEASRRQVEEVRRVQEAAQTALSQMQEQMRRWVEETKQREERLKAELEEVKEELRRKQEETERKLREKIEELEASDERRRSMGRESGGFKIEDAPVRIPAPLSFPTSEVPKPPAEPGVTNKWLGLFGRASPSSSAASSSSSSSSVGQVMPTRGGFIEKSAITFGKADWEKYFGSIGNEPALPPNIHEILASPCPFVPGKKVGETHLLTLIPQTVNGRALTLDSLEELIKAPRNGGHSSAYQSYWDNLKAEFGKKGVARSYWVLMTKDVIKGTMSKRYDKQRGIVESQAVRHGLLRGGGVPTLLEAAVSILMEQVKTGRRLYSDFPYTYTRCEERVSGTSNQTVVGGLASAGLYIIDDTYDNGDVGLACSWKF